MNRIKHRRKTSLKLECLEPRLAMAVYLNEVHFDPLFGNAETDQYIEIRSDSESSLPDGTYLVVLEGSSGVNQSAGRIHTLFDLSNQAFGSNGMLVLAEFGNRYSFAPGARVLQGTTVGFRGMPGNIYSTEHTLSNHIDFIVGSNSYLLIQTNTRPQLGQDIDQQDDGRPEGIWNAWNVLDGFSALYWIDQGTPTFGYAPIVFREDGQGSSPIAQTIVDTEDLSYVARVGDSIGYAANDWVAGNTVEGASGGPADFRFSHGTFGTPRPYAFSGRAMDHLGASNFVAQVSGTVFHDDNGDGKKQPSESPYSGVKIIADSNGNGALDSLTYGLDPDAYLDRAELTNQGIGVTLTSAGSDNLPVGFVVRARNRFPDNVSNPRLFASEGIPWFSSSGRLRMDFYQPAQSVSIQFTGTSTVTYGRLEAFSASGQSLGFIRTRALASNQSERISLNYPDARIAYAVAYCDNDHESSSPFGQLDDLQYRIPESSTTARADGTYSMQGFPVGVYQIISEDIPTAIRSLPSQGYHQLQPSSRTGLNSADFVYRSNQSPVFPDQVIRMRENEANDFVLGMFNASDPDAGQSLSFATVSGDDQGIFGYQGKEIVLRRTELVNYELQQTHVLIVRANDSFTPSKSATATITIHVDDVNDPPIATSSTSPVLENSLPGTIAAQVTASDEDRGSLQQFQFRIVEGNTNDAFVIDADTGTITVQGLIDFESQAVYPLVVEVSEKTAPPKSTRTTVSITVLDINESPSISTELMLVDENSLPGTEVGSIPVTDPDRNQTHLFAVEGGTAAAWLEVERTTGALRVRQGVSLDFERDPVRDLVVSVQDSGTPPLSESKTITISLRDKNDPPVIATTTITTPENQAANATLGSIMATDQDVGQTLRYSLVGGPDASKLRLDATTGAISLQPNAQLDFESQPTWMFNVEVEDNGAIPAKSTLPITIQIVDRNDAPTFDPVTFSLAENSSGGTLVGTLLARDQDAGEILRYQIADNNLFVISPESGKLEVKAGAVLNFELTPRIELPVQVTDHAGSIAQTTATIQLTDRNDPPIVKGSIARQSALISRAWTYTFPADLFEDEDAGDQLTFQALSGNGFSLPAWLSFNAATRTFSGTPTEAVRGVQSILVNAIDTNRAFAGVTFPVEVIGNAWHNYDLIQDVNSDLAITAHDALLVINYINLGLPMNAPAMGLPAINKLDVNADNAVSAVDALIVINRINLGGSGEGESREPSNSADLHPMDALESSLDLAVNLIADEQHRRRLERVAAVHIK